MEDERPFPDDEDPYDEEPRDDEALREPDDPREGLEILPADEEPYDDEVRDGLPCWGRFEDALPPLPAPEG